MFIYEINFFFGITKNKKKSILHEIVEKLTQIQEIKNIFKFTY